MDQIQNQEVDLTNLPINLLNKLPFSIRTKKNKYLFSELPSEIQYLIQDYLYKKPPDIEYNDVIRDLKPEITIYNDLTPLNLRYAIIEYFKNYINVQVGSYPFDVQFGCGIKKFLQSKDTTLIQTLLSNELQNMIIVLTNDYNTPVKIIKAQLYKNATNSFGPEETYSEYSFHIELEVLNETIIINF